MNLSAWLAMLLLTSGLSSLQTAAPLVTADGVGTASFHLDWPEASIPHWAMEVKEDGRGSYEIASEGAGDSATARRTIVVGAETLERLRGGYRTVLDGNCETKLKHLAKTGTKHIAYTMKGSDAWSSCTFNYSDDKGLMDAVAAFQAIAETIQAGDKLQYSHRYDRLGLDGELDHLEAEAKDGHAIAFQNIAPVLQSIVDDERVIERARRKAARLLQSADPVAASAQ